MDRAQLEHEYEALARAGRWSNALALLEGRAAEATDPTERAQLLARAGALALERFAHQSKAIAHFEASLELSPEQPEIRRRLRMLYERRRDHEALARLADVPQDAAAMRERTARPWWQWWKA
jgi:tetratricopeptide (TPR) repeat protein